LEMITEEVAKVITQTVSVPTIGIGSGRYCDGQVLVLHDILGLYPRFVPKFAKRYADLAARIGKALGEYASEVRRGTFPEEKHVFKIDDAERNKIDLHQKSSLLAPQHSSCRCNRLSLRRQLENRRTRRNTCASSNYCHSGDQE